MSKKIFAIVLAVVLLFSVCLVSACDDTVPEETLDEKQQAFVDAVAAISLPITIDSGASIDAAYSEYAFLDDYERDSETVTASKALLDGYQSEYLALKDDDDDQDNNNNDNAEKELVSRFVAAVEALPAIDDLTVEDRTAINSANALYNRLTLASKASDEVTSAYAKLQKASNRVTELEEAANQQEWQRMADEFIVAVADIDEVTLENGPTMEDLLFAYGNFPDGVKNIGGMAEAKEVLDALYEQYKVMKDEHDVNEFVSAVSAIGEVTLEREAAIVNAENLHKYMSENAKSKDNVVAAYEILTVARSRYDELFAVVEAERIAYFIEVVGNIRTDVENVDITWYDALSTASKAYWILTYESMQLPEVKEAFDVWDRAQMAFDKLGYKQIPMVDPNLLFSGDDPPHIVVQMEDDMLNPLKEFYKVSTMAELAKQVNAYLNIYVNGVYVASGELNVAGLGHIIFNGDVVAILKKLSAEHSEIVNGGSFAFSIHFADKQQRYIHSNETKVSQAKVYFW